MIVRLLIHHPECLGPALSGEAVGLHRVYEDALDHMLDTPQYGSSHASPRDSTTDLGVFYLPRGTLSRGETIIYPRDSSPPVVPLPQRSSSYGNLNLMSTQLVLSFYTSLVHLLAYCAPGKQVLTNKASNGINGSNSGTTGGSGSSISGNSGTGGSGSGTTSNNSGTTGASGSGISSDRGATGASGSGTGSNNGTPGGSASGTSGTSGTTSNSCSSSSVKTGAEQTCNILSNVISVGDLRGILSLSFARDGVQGIVPAHKEAALLFLSRVYGVPDCHHLRDLLTDAFLPDIKTALKMAAVSHLLQYM